MSGGGAPGGLWLRLGVERAGWPRPLDEEACLDAGSESTQVRMVLRLEARGPGLQAALCSSHRSREKGYRFREVDEWHLCWVEWLGGRNDVLCGG